jgi:hypothetical protein
MYIPAVFGDRLFVQPITISFLLSLLKSNATGILYPQYPVAPLDHPL